MKTRLFNRYYLLSCLGILLASCYPLAMGIRVIHDMIAYGAVSKEQYPKYVIPYSPMCMAIILGVLILPLCMRLLKKYALAGGSCAAIGTFFLLEWLFEQKIVVSNAESTVNLEDWQMLMCYVPSDRILSYKTHTAVEILMGDYNPAFKLHFYMIAVVLILTVLNCFYGFAQLLASGNKTRLKPLVLQSVCTFAFLGLCVLACFTAFWRDGNILVSPLSAALMSIFFVLLGVTAGVFVGSFLLEKRRWLSVLVPAMIASVMTFLMYIGERILLNGHLYRFGISWLFKGIPNLVFAPFDLLLIAISGCITAWIFAVLSRKHSKTL